MTTATRSPPKAGGKKSDKKKGQAPRLTGNAAWAWASLTALIAGASTWYLTSYAPEHVARMESDNALTSAAIGFVEQCAMAPVVVSGVAAAALFLGIVAGRVKLYVGLNAAFVLVLGFCFWSLGSPVEGIRQSIDATLDRAISD